MTLQERLRKADAARRAIKLALDVTSAVYEYKRVVAEIRGISEDLELVRRTKPVGTFDPTKPRRRRLSGLPVNWVDMMVRGSYDRLYTDHVATVALTGCRSSEAAHGVTITIDAGLLKCRIHGKKVTDWSGQPWREQVWTIEGEAALYLARRVREAGGRFVVSAPNGRAVEDAIRNVSKQLFPELKKRITASSFRNQLSADLKADGHTSEDIARALGHITDGTQQHYGVCQQGRGGRAWLVAVTAARPIKAKKRERVAKLREQGMRGALRGGLRPQGRVGRSRLRSADIGFVESTGRMSDSTIAKRRLTIDVPSGISFRMEAPFSVRPIRIPPISNGGQHGPARIVFGSRAQSGNSGSHRKRSPAFWNRAEHDHAGNGAR